MVDFNNADVQKSSRVTLSAKDGSGTNITIGIANEMSFKESRDVTEIFTFGGDAENPKANVPNLVKGKELTLKSVVLFTKDLMSVLNGATIYSLVDQLQYFSISETIKNSDNSDAKTTTYNDCIIKSVGFTKNISGGEIIVNEDVTVSYRSISHS